MATYNATEIALKAQAKIVQQIQKEIARVRTRINCNEEILGAGFKMIEMTTQLIQLPTIREQELFIQQNQEEYQRLKKLDGKLKNLEKTLDFQMDTVNLKVGLANWEQQLCREEDKYNALLEKSLKVL